MIGIITLIFIVFIYFIPYIVAKSKNHKQAEAIGVLNLLAGWTLIGWVVAAVWASVNEK